MPRAGARRWLCCLPAADASRDTDAAPAAEGATSLPRHCASPRPSPQRSPASPLAAPLPPLRLPDAAARAASGASASSSGDCLSALHSPAGGRGGSWRAGVGGAPPGSARRSDSVRVSFEKAARELREVHAHRLAAQSVRLRHPEDAQRPRRTPPRTTTAVALGTAADGGKCVNQYVKLRKLGQGSYGKVVLYRSRENGQLFAIKIMSRAALSRRHVSRGASALTDAMREVALLHALEHPNIVRLEEVIDDPEEDRLYIVMEYLEGGPVLQDGGAPLSHAAAARAVADVAEALRYCHWQGVCHGDVKPDNMLVGADGRVRLTDFSVSQMVDDVSAEAETPDTATPPRIGTPLGGGGGGGGGGGFGGAAAEAGARSGSRGSTVGRTPGTPAYTAPECTAGGAFCGEAADVWALGVSLFAMLTGAPPFVGDTLMATYELISAAPLELPPSLEGTPVGDLLRRMLDKEPATRATLEEVLAHPWVTQHAPPLGGATSAGAAAAPDGGGVA